MDFKQLIQDYAPNQHTIDVVRQVRSAFMVGITAAGKDTIYNRLMATGDYHTIVSHTTRAPRANDGVMEQDGVEYHFVTKEEMQSLLLEGKMVEANVFGSNVYGTSAMEFESALTKNKIATTDIDINGIASFRAIAPDVVTAIFIVPPSYEVWIERLKKRYDSQEELIASWHDRRSEWINELRTALEQPHFHFLINDDLDRAVRVAHEMALEPERHQRKDDESRRITEQLLRDIEARVDIK